MTRLQLRYFLLSGFLGFSAFALAQAKEDEPAETTSIQTVTASEYRQHLESLKVLVQACEKNSFECDTKKIGNDERVESDGFRTRWSWLREVVSSARDAAQPDREKTLGEAIVRLNEDEALAERTPLKPGDEFQSARKKTDEVLARPEFRTVSEQSYIEQELAKFWQWVDQVFGGVSRLGKRSPWLVPVMEWGLLTLSVVGLIAWALRTMQRQRLAVRIESGASAEVWQKESDNWAELARAEAARKDWRAAVHCLYWATIVMMEGRKLWRQNHARTPREYVSLLEPGSRMQQALRRFTQLFERIWYGLRPAAESDYASALVMFEELRGA